MGLDCILEWFVRAAVLAFKRLQTGGWIAEEANVTTAIWRQPFACDLALIHYRYSVGAKECSGSHDEPFWTMGSWKGPVRSLPPGTAVQIRYDPQDPAKSVFVDRWWRKL